MQCSNIFSFAVIFSVQQLELPVEAEHRKEQKSSSFSAEGMSILLQSTSAHTLIHARSVLLRPAESRGKKLNFRSNSSPPLRLGTELEFNTSYIDSGARQVNKGRHPSSVLRLCFFSTIPLYCQKVTLSDTFRKKHYQPRPRPACCTKKTSRTCSLHPRHTCYFRCGNQAFPDSCMIGLGLA